MIEILQMDWPFAVVLIAAIIGMVVVYGIRKTMAEEADRRARKD